MVFNYGLFRFADHVRSKSNTFRTEEIGQKMTQGHLISCIALVALTGRLVVQVLVVAQVGRKWNSYQEKRHCRKI